MSFFPNFDENGKIRLDWAKIRKIRLGKAELGESG